MGARLFLIEKKMTGHMIGDHSHDHMEHNTKEDFGNKYKRYLDPYVDYTYFGDMSVNEATNVMEKYGLDQSTIIRVSNTMRKCARLPFTNNWRIQGEGGFQFVGKELEQMIHTGS